MPATVTDDGLGIVCVFSDGSRANARQDYRRGPAVA
ncbi:hypothetical protein ThrDRAFT_04677 [Frankia casuarinae]|nr:hypothetical protein CcI6DRAFT_04830 [Frankia sp. CcI6]EYT89706.1 hypothetical protein ThrDRAFT_04677 [Frankia casuarinae]KDA40713.1 hypothetical protein BMG523Draft_04483 [Frankia sp. BMG5.23]OAA18533.1 hypothetical protein AAY23_11243 [Frankia casuarinae]